MEDIKFVISELNKEPFNKKINVIGYDNLKGDHINILFQIFKLIDYSVDLSIVNQLEPDDLVAQILETLRIFKYRPPINTTSDEFREGIIIGDESTYTHIYSYLFRNLSELQKRAYLAKFLVKMEVSPDLETDNDIAEAYKRYEELIENFKIVHSNYELLRKNSSSIQEVQKDVKSMELEKEQINNKLDYIKRRENANNKPELLATIKVLHEEKEKSGKMLKQKLSVENEIKTLKDRSQQLQAEFNNLSKFTDESDDVKNFFEKMVDEVNSKKHLIEKILPKEIESLKKYIDTLSKLDLNSQTGTGYLENLNKNIKLLSTEINKEIEKRMLNKDSDDDKLISLKQNALVISRKKAELEKEYKEFEDQLNELKRRVNDKMYDKDGKKKLVGEELKTYVNQVKKKMADHNDKKEELKEMQNEMGLLTRTFEIVEKERKRLHDDLIRLEEDKGIVGYFSNQDNLEIVVSLEKEKESLDRNELTAAISELTGKIGQIKNDLQPLIKELKPLRIEHQSLQRDYDEVKSKYDTIATSLESKLVGLKEEVKNGKQKINDLESSKFKLECEIEISNAKKKWIEDNHSEIGENKIIEQIQDEISLATKNLESLIDKHRLLKDTEGKKQMQLWFDLIRLMKLKNHIYMYNDKADQEMKAKTSQTKDYLALEN